MPPPASTSEVSQEESTTTNADKDVMFYFILAIGWSLTYGLVNGFNAW